MGIHRSANTLPAPKSGRVLFYNPGYEVSAARGIVRYTPPAQVRNLRSSLSPLMYLLGKEGDRLWKVGQYPAPDEEIVPWGWAPEVYGLRAKAYREGEESMAHMRFLASRWRSYDLVKHMQDLFRLDFESLTRPIPLSKYRPSSSDAPRGRVVVKSEFSSSGRGIRVYEDISEIPVGKLLAEREEHFIEHFLPNQGDRGYEFYRYQDGKTVYLGPSDFRTCTGRYEGNRLRPLATIDKEWQSIPTYPSHHSYIEMLTQALGMLELGTYQGYLGVDTIVYRDEAGRLRLHPCIEINVRPTMGHIALEITKKCSEEDFDGYLQIFSGNERSLTAVLEGSDFLDLGEFPSSIQSGRYHLNAIESHTQFVARLDISSIQSL